MDESMKYTRNCPLLFEITFNFTFNYISRKMTNEDNDRSKCPYLAKDKWVSRKFKKSLFNINLQSFLTVHLFIANVSIHCSAIFSKEQICIYLQTHNGASWTEGWISDLQFWVVLLKNIFFSRVLLFDNS